jgi:diguanylate cyclase (GGDEF)-like protein
MKIYQNGFAHLEYEGNVINGGNYNPNIKNYDNKQKYFSVSKELVNGMTLVLSASYDDIKQIRYDIGLKIVYVVVLLALLFSLIAFFVVRKITYPLKKLTEASVKLSNGDYDVEIIHNNTYEIKLLSTAFENMTLHLKEHERMQHLLAYRDSLTGLRNTNSYWAWITDFDKEIETKEIVFGVLVFDINYLKETNDRYGHDVGNKLIVSAARLISDIFRRSPVFRIGGDEFLVILRNRDYDDVKLLLKNFDEECRNKSIDTDKESIPVSVAKGFAIYDPDNDTNFIDVFNKADDAMYENKRKIKNQI